MVVHNHVKEEENQKLVDRSILQEKEENQCLITTQHVKRSCKNS
jgi:hypothetical protein